MSAVPELTYDAPAAIWLVGPTDSRPFERWIDGAVAAVETDFEVADPEQSAYVQAVLRVFGQAPPSPLSERLLRWRDLTDSPLPVQLGMTERRYWSEDELQGLLGATDEALAEPAVVEELDTPSDQRVRRSISYSLAGDDGRLIAGVRYVVEGPARDYLVVLNTATDVPGQLLEALEDLDALAVSARVLVHA